MDKKIYNYRDENGVILYSKIREVSATDISHKKFYWQSYKDGKTVYNSNGSRKVLYQLPLLYKAIDAGVPIYLVEGEKDCDTLGSHLVLATTTPVTKRWDDSFTQSLAGADVIVLYDNDEAGLQRRDLICKKLYRKVKRLRVVDLPGLEYRDSHGLDVTDWLEMGNTIEQLKGIVEQTPDYQPEQSEPESDSSQNFCTVSLDELLNLELPEREMLLDPFLPSQGLVLLVAKRGVGKTHVALGIAYAVASGSTFLRWSAPAAKKVLYIDGEMPAVLMKERLLMITAMSEKKPNTDFLQLLTPDLQSKTMPDLSDKKGRESIEPLIADVDLIIIDNISCLFRNGSENESESWQEAQEWALDLRRRGKSVLFVHHAGKSGKQRGTSKREDILDSVILLKHADDYKAEEGAHFEIIFDKSRHFSGEDAKSFQAHLQSYGNTYRWELSDAPQEKELHEIARLKNNGYTIKEIMERTQLTKAQVEYRTANAKEKGLINK